METIEVKKVCGICAHFPTIPVHCYVSNKRMHKGHPSCDKFELHDMYKSDI